MKDRAPIIALPPVIFAVNLGIGLGLHWMRPVAAFPFPESALMLAGCIVAAASAALALSARSAMKRAGTAIDPRKTTTAIAETGPFRISRNPMYLSLLLLLLGIAVGLNSAWLIAMCLPFFLVVHYGVVRREECYLEQKFGEPYRRYRRKVRRWI